MLDSVRTLGYHPNAGARALASKRANVIALVLPLRAGMHVPVLMQFATSVVTTARRFDHDVLLMTADEGSDGLRGSAASAMVDGLMVMDVEMHDTPGAAAARARPAERADRLPGRLGRADLRRPRLRRGRARPAWNTWPDSGTGRSRCSARPARGLRAGHRLRPPHQGGLRRGGRPAAGLTGVAHAVRGERRRGLRRDRAAARPAPGLSGLVVHNEAAVGHVLGACAPRPAGAARTSSVVAICPDEVAERSSPALTSVLIPAEEVGRQAVRLLMGKLEGRAVPGRHPAPASAHRTRQHLTERHAAERTRLPAPLAGYLPTKGQARFPFRKGRRARLPS